MNPSDYRPAGSSDPNAHPDREPGANPAALPPIAGEIAIPSKLRERIITIAVMVLVTVLVTLVNRQFGTKIEVPVVVVEGAAPGTAVHVQGAGAKADVQDRRRPLRDRLIQRLIDDAVEKGADRDKAERIVRDLDTERPILDWLRSGGWKELLELVLKLIALL
jgi:hypothetical protein